MKYYVGEIPSRPLVVVLQRETGEAYNLAQYSSVVLTGTGLPAGTTSILSASEGRIQYAFTAPFLDAQVLEVRAEMTTSNGRKDYGEPIKLTVYNTAPGYAGFTTPALVEQVTGTPVSLNDVVRAQSLVSLAIGLDLADDDSQRLSVRDASYARQAIAWQAEAFANGTAEAVAPSGLASMSTGDVSVSYSGNSDSAVTWLAPLAKVAIKRLSWMGSVRTMHATPYSGGSTAQPNLWTTVGRRNRL